MKYDFDKPISRVNTASIKWDGIRTPESGGDILPLGLADMDFLSPPAVTDAIIDRAKHGAFGYTLKTDNYFKAITEWMKRRFGWSVRPEWISHNFGVLTSISFVLHVITEPGDKVVIQSPTFHPLIQVTEDNDCVPVINPLRCNGGRYEMDFDDLAKKIDGKTKVMLLCSPHNPVGRVWTREELTRLGEICQKHNLLVISDEVHSGIIFPGHRHTPFAGLSEDTAQRTFVCTAPSKAFNLAGLCWSIMIIPNADLREKYVAALKKFYFNFGANLFGTVATEAAYNKGDDWLDELTEYVKANLEYVKEYLRQHIPQIKVIEPEGTYLVWLDCRDLGMNSQELEEFFRQKAGVLFTQGYAFGQDGEGFVRLNVGCPRPLLAEGLERIKNAVQAK
ncbi:MAG: MalY/PatB family protein [bacterium]|jgi:cystathionine beta-lyase